MNSIRHCNSCSIPINGKNQGVTLCKSCSAKMRWATNRELRPKTKFFRTCPSCGDKKYRNWLQNDISQHCRKCSSDIYLAKARELSSTLGARCKRYTYVSEIAGEIFVDGTWELRVAKFFDLKKLDWRRNQEAFRYLLDGTEHKYTPDFYVSNWDAYIEVKGLETAIDKIKWEQFPKKLFVWKSEDLKAMGIFSLGTWKETGFELHTQKISSHE